MSRAETRPTSWLQLEQYHLAELDPAARERVTARLDASSEDRDCLDLIEADRRALPPLQLPERRSVLRWRPWTWGGLGLATAAAALLLTVLPRETSTPLGAGLKGGETTARLVRERDGSVVDRPTTFAPGDRFKAVVTCPPEGPSTWSVLLFQADEVHVPLVASVPCGNDVALPGAFTLTGATPARVCIAPNVSLSQAKLVRTTDDLEDDAVCVDLLPVPR